MANYKYEVMDASSKTKTGSVEAESLEEAQLMLRKEGLTVISISEGSALDKEISIGVFKQGIKPREFSVLCKQFVSILQAGVPIISALEMLYEQSVNPTLKQALLDVKEDVEKGETLANAMDRTGEFPSILINMIAAGEASGSLEIAFDRMATHFEKDARIKGMVKKAMIYPAVVLVVMIAVIIIMMVLVIPNFVGMFADMGTELPPLTRFVMAASDFVVNRWYVLVAIVASVVVAYKVFASQEYGKHVIARVTLSIPIFGDMVTKTACSRFSRTLSTLMAAGMSLIDAIDITARTMDNLLYKEALMDTKEQVAKGIPLSQPLIETGLFPAMICQMTQIGEETGNIEEMLNKCADYYDEEVEMATQALSAAMEPIIIVVLAGVVGVIVMAVMQPMFSMYSAMDNM